MSIFPVASLEHVTSIVRLHEVPGSSDYIGSATIIRHNDLAILRGLTMTVPFTKRHWQAFAAALRVEGYRAAEWERRIGGKTRTFRRSL